MLASILGTIVTVYGLVAGASSLLQARRMVRRGTSEDVSLSFLGMYVAGYALWLVYGLSVGSLPLIIVDVAGVLSGTCTLALALSLRPRRPTEQAPGRRAGSVDARRTGRRRARRLSRVDLQPVGPLSLVGQVPVHPAGPAGGLGPALPHRPVAGPVSQGHRAPIATLPAQHVVQVPGLPGLDWLPAEPADPGQGHPSECAPPRVRAAVPQPPGRHRHLAKGWPRAPSVRLISTAAAGGPGYGHPRRLPQSGPQGRGEFSLNRPRGVPPVSRLQPHASG